MGFPGDLLGAPASTDVNERHSRLASESDGATPPFRWIPIRSLAARHRPRILAHLLALSEADRYLRFGYAASDSQVAHYVDLIDFLRDEVFGIFNRRLELVAMAHLALMPRADNSGEPAQAEFGVSVTAKSRGRGYGGRLFDHAVLHARNRQVDTLVIHALSENTSMLRIVRKAGATIDREGSESQAKLKLPSDDMASHIGEIIEDQAAELNYRFKVQARRVEDLIDKIGEVKDRYGKNGQAASE